MANNINAGAAKPAANLGTTAPIESVGEVAKTAAATNPSVTADKKQPAVDQEGYVKVKKDSLDRILQIVDNYEELQEKVKRLESVSNKAYLANYDDKNKKKLGKIVSLLTIDGKIISSWGNMPINITEKNEYGKWYEEQKVKLNFEDGTEMEMPYVFFSRRYQKMPVRVLGEEKLLDSDEGEVIFRVEDNDGREYKVNSKFVN